MRGITSLLVPSPFLSSASLLSLLKPYPSLKLKPLPSPSSRSQTLAMAKTLDEPDVGISCYVSSLPGFQGVLKQRYADFIVNEVDCDGKVAHLTSFDLPPDCNEDKQEEKLDSTDRSYVNEIESFRVLCGEKDAELLKGLLEKIVPLAENDVDPIVLSADDDKSHRAEVHNFFKKNLNFLVTDTVEESEGSLKCIRVRLSSGAQGGSGGRGKKRKNMGKPFDSRGSDNWPEHVGKFLRLVGLF